jgi:hypothetical protein
MRAVAFLFASALPVAALFRAMVAGEVGRWLENPMAEHGEITYDTADGNDYAAHEATYQTFIKLAKYGSGSAIVVLILMALFLV